MYKLIPSIKNYAWGCIGIKSLVARLTNQPIDDNKPYSELWIGTHQDGCAFVEGPKGKQNLREFLSENSEWHGRSSGVIDGQLPFLLKVLSIAQPLSIQVHPTKLQASQLHSIYPDANHKPELALPLTDFEAFCGLQVDSVALYFLENQLLIYCGYQEEQIKVKSDGFHIAREAQLVEQAPHFISQLNNDLHQEQNEIIEEQQDGRIDLTNEDENDLMKMDKQKRKRQQLDSKTSGKKRRRLNSEDGDIIEDDNNNKDKEQELQQTKKNQFNHLKLKLSQAFEILIRLHQQYPGDAGCVMAAFFLIHSITPPINKSESNGIFIGSCVPHGYVFGDCIEIMATSDNVIRAGLTPKYRDAQTFAQMLDSCSAEKIMQLSLSPKRIAAGVREFAVNGITDFKIVQVSIGDEDEDIESVLQAFISPVRSVRVAFVVDGKCEISIGRSKDEFEEEEEEESDQLKKTEADPGTALLIPPNMHILIRSIKNDKDFRESKANIFICSNNPQI
ncbi:MAG: mannose-6-phosphate isomerase [Streblomastix strix]|uniref:mannose-6-phosphate isomerase n=1 Tax=Streblomastix strix TaxID=222440 RepID=A0A5J4WG21_9EUKA|nr:MAG: mannose-6-phosphate isomerase [Streblomastix strix]